MNSEKRGGEEMVILSSPLLLTCCGFQGFCFSAFFGRAIGGMKQASLEGEARALRIANEVLPAYGDLLPL